MRRRRLAGSGARGRSVLGGRCSGAERHAAAQSGTRLKLRWWVWDDGAMQWDRGQFVDTERHEWCYPRQWDDGTTYCTPDAVEGVFVDADCTTMIARVESLQVKPYVSRSERPVWPEQYGRTVTRGIYALGQPTTTPAAQYVLRNGGCDPRDFTPPADFYTLGPELPRSELVAIVETLPDPSLQVSLIHRTTADGLRVPHVLHDSRLDRRCMPAASPDRATTSCEPVDAWESSSFADAQCTRALVGTRGLVPPAITMSQSESCHTYYLTGLPIPTPTMRYRRSGDTCQPENLMPAPNELVWFDGAQVDLTTVDRVTESAPDRRLQRIHIAGLDDTWLYDAANGIDCLHDHGACSRPTPDAFFAQHYIDAQCTMLGNFARVRTPPCKPAPATLVAYDTLYEIGAPVTGGLWQYSPGSPRPCAYYPPIDLEGYVLHALSPGVPLEPTPVARIVDPDL
jgi:hypothetical protein